MKNRRAGSLVLAAVAACFLAACTNNVKSGTELLEKEKYGEAAAAFEEAAEEAEKKAEMPRRLTGALGWFIMLRGTMKAPGQICRRHWRRGL